jgi:hypothetical protein
VFDGWGTLTRSVKALDSSEPLLVAQGERLEAELREAMRLRSLYRRLLGKLQMTSEQLQESIGRGKDAESRLRMLLRSTYGSTNPQLVRHGISPRRSPRRKKGSVAVPPPEEATEKPE